MPEDSQFMAEAKQILERTEEMSERQWVREERLLETRLKQLSKNEMIDNSCLPSHLMSSGHKAGPQNGTTY